MVNNNQDVKPSSAKEEKPSIFILTFSQTSVSVQVFKPVSPNQHPKFFTVLDEVPPFPSVQEIPLVMIDTEKGFKILLKVFLQKTVIAVDLEVIFTF